MSGAKINSKEIARRTFERQDKLALDVSAFRHSIDANNTKFGDP